MRGAVLAVVAGLVGLAALTASPDPGTPSLAWLPPAVTDSFVHPDHAGVFPTCTACHAGAAEPERPLWPAPADCGTERPEGEGAWQDRARKFFR